MLRSYSCYQEIAEILKITRDCIYGNSSEGELKIFNEFCNTGYYWFLSSIDLDSIELTMTPEVSINL